MQPLTARDVYEEILAHINKQGGSYPNWYCGITSNWVNRLVIEHKVPKEGHPYIARQCYTSDDALNWVAMVRQGKGIKPRFMFMRISREL